jgi:hypothetical protein
MEQVGLLISLGVNFNKILEVSESVSLELDVHPHGKTSGHGSRALVFAFKV